MGISGNVASGYLCEKQVLGLYNLFTLLLQNTERVRERKESRSLSHIWVDNLFKSNKNKIRPNIITTHTKKNSFLSPSLLFLPKLLPQRVRSLDLFRERVYLYGCVLGDGSIEIYIAQINSRQINTFKK